MRDRIKKIQSVAAAETALTLEEHIKELKLLRETAKAEGDIKVAITTEVKRGEVKQFYVKKVELGAPGEFEQLTNEELQRAIIGHTRELANSTRDLPRSCGSTSRRRARPGTDLVPDCGNRRPDLRIDVLG